MEHAGGHVWAWAKIALAWAGVMFGGLVEKVTLAQLALVLTMIFTALQIFKIVRDIRRERRLDELDHKLRRRGGDL